MELDVTKLNSGLVTTYEIHEKFLIPKDLYQKSSILDLKDLFLNGMIEKIDNDLITLNASVSGIMILEDSISLEPLEYSFSCKIEEELQDLIQKSTNTLDITDILWQNIMLEVPLKFTNVKNFNAYQGDGWRLVSEDSMENTNNPFKELKDMMGGE